MLANVSTTDRHSNDPALSDLYSKAKVAQGRIQKMFNDDVEV